MNFYGGASRNRLGADPDPPVLAKRERSGSLP